ncbi:homoserine O-acetyltransferase [Aureococcus anophagefferens]|nr:homoserine O-acetyltransferase [Aureococcus anophagefferens]
MGAMRRFSAARALAPRAATARALVPTATRCVASRAAAARAVTSRTTHRSRRAPCRPLSAGLKAAADDEGGGLADEYSGTMDGSSGELHVVESFELESGRVLRDVGVKYKTWGALNAARDNVLVVCHALTGSHELELWWGDLLGPGKAFDTDRYFVVCVNTLGSPYGSCSPLTPDGDAADRSAYGARFPTTRRSATPSASRRSS